MLRKIPPVAGIEGTISLPGDKSISHRYAMFNGLAEGSAVLTNYSTGADCESTLGCMRSLGVRCDRSGSTVEIEGAGSRGLKAPGTVLDAGNSGTTMRLLSGILAGQPFASEIAGDESLSSRPMGRILAPLRAMGASAEARDGSYPPLRFHTGALRPIRYELPVASAQVKSAVLLAGLSARGLTTVVEPVQTRDHTEIALRRLGADVAVRGREISIRSGPRLVARDMRIPSDLSSAVFFIAAALILPGSRLRIKGVGINPTRTAVLSVLKRMGAEMDVLPDPAMGGEPSATIEIRGTGPLAGGEICGATVAGVIDEIPMLAVLGAVSQDGLRIRDARELRVKETDRIDTVVRNLRAMGVDVVEHEDGMDIKGRSALRAAGLDSFGDHRIAMAFSVAALVADGESALKRADAASVSFPEFYDVLGSIVRE